MGRDDHLEGLGAGLQRDLEFMAAIVAACAAGGDSTTLSRIASPGFDPLDDAPTVQFAAMLPNMAGGGAASFTGLVAAGVAR